MTIDCILHEKDPPTGLIIIIDMENVIKKKVKQTILLSFFVCSYLYGI